MDLKKILNDQGFLVVNKEECQCSRCNASIDIEQEKIVCQTCAKTNVITTNISSLDLPLPIPVKYMVPSKALDVLCGMWFYGFKSAVVEKKPLHIFNPEHMGVVDNWEHKGNHPCLAKQGYPFFYLCSCHQTDEGEKMFDFSGRRPLVDWIDQLYPLNGFQTHEVLTKLMGDNFNSTLAGFSITEKFSWNQGKDTSERVSEGFTTELIVRRATSSSVFPYFTEFVKVSYFNKNDKVAIIGAIMKALSFLENLPTPEQLEITEEVYKKEEALRRRRLLTTP